MSDVDPGSYVEIQMDRQTVVLGAVGFLVLMALAFMLGRWTAPDAEPSRPVAAAGEADADGENPPAVEEQAVDGEPMFGDRVVSAAGAPPIAPVPARSTAPPVGATSRSPATGAAPPPAADARGATESRTATGEARPRPRDPSPEEPATAAGSVGGWVIQVAAVKEASEARALERKLGGKGYPVRIVAEGDYHKVQVGPFGKKSEAQVVERRLKREENLATWLKSL